jgi:hypothetical protein
LLCAAVGASNLTLAGSFFLLIVIRAAAEKSIQSGCEMMFIGGEKQEIRKLNGKIRLTFDWLGYTTHHKQTV